MKGVVNVDVQAHVPEERKPTDKCDCYQRSDYR